MNKSYIQKIANKISNDVMETTTLCRSSIDNLIKSGDFPSNYAIMAKRKAWLESEVQTWLQTKITPYN